MAKKKTEENAAVTVTADEEKQKDLRSAETQEQEPVEEQEHEPVEEPVTKPEHEPVEESVTEPGHELAEEPVTKPEHGPVEESVTEHGHEPAEEPVTKSGAETEHTILFCVTPRERKVALRSTPEFRLDNGNLAGIVDENSSTRTFKIVEQRNGFGRILHPEELWIDLKCCRRL